MTQITLTDFVYILGFTVIIAAMFYTVGYSNGVKSKRGGSDG